jgi:hypothetical protein
MNNMKKLRRLRNIFSKAFILIKNKGFYGVYYIVKYGTFRWLVSPLATKYCKFFRKKEYFTFKTNKLNYFYHNYNMTWVNERTIEIPIIEYFLRSFTKSNNKILEVGNVMNYYHQFPHIIIDKYENATGVLKEDIFDFKSIDKFNYIFSISTMEHIGWDGFFKDPNKIHIIIKNLYNHLASGGLMIISFPLGYNPYLDLLIKNKDLGFTELIIYQRLKLNRWKEVKLEEVINSEWKMQEMGANLLAIAIFVSSG